MNFEEVYKHYLIYVEKRHKKQSFITVCQDFNKHILPYFNNFNLDDITKKDIINWESSILSFNYSNNYNLKLYSIFNNFLNYCLSLDYIKENYLSSVGSFPKKIEHKRVVVYNIHQFRKFRYYVSNFVIKQFFNFMFFYGTRPSEAMALRFLDLKYNYIYIRHSIERKGNRELSTPKNQSSIRIIKINLLMLFRIWLLKKYYIKIYKSFSNDYFIFGGLKPLSPTTIDRYKFKAYSKANLPPITEHQFRHSYATMKIHNKVPIDIVSRSMGHSKVSTTLDVYLHQEKNTYKVLFD